MNIICKHLQIDPSINRTPYEMRGFEVIKLCHYALDIPIHWCNIKPNAVVIMVTVNIYFVTCGGEISVDQKFVPFLSIFLEYKN